MSTGSSSFAFRPHLDGVRALAVLAVFVFHATPSALPGGFIGVDVFFVLSGFLITSILLDQVESGRYSLGQFYGRRIKRLLPASLALLVTVTVVTAVYGATIELQSRLNEVRATALYVANWNLIRSSDNYFAETFAASPLRHMWSLAIEEQFYFVWPILLVGLVAWLGAGTRLAAPLAGLALISMVLLNVRYSPENASRAYYGTDTRVFQPLLGAILAVLLQGRREAELPTWLRRSGPVVGVAGAVGLGACALYLDGGEPAYFRWGAILVTLLAIGVIIDGEVNPRSRLTRLLSIKPLVLLGAISYGFYLWHWPIILWIQPPDGADFFDRRLTNVMQFVATLALASASYIMIERPIRLPTWPVRAAVGGAALAMVITIGLANSLLRLPDTPIADALADRSFEPCPDDPQPCIKVDASPGAPTVVLVGDSTAQAYNPGLEALAEEFGFRYVQAAVGGCPIGHRLIATGADGELHKPSNFMCYDEIPGIYDKILQDYNPSLILATAWNERNQHIIDGDLVKTGTPQHVRQTFDALNEAADTLTSNGADLAFIDILPPGPDVSCLETSLENEGDCLRPVADPSVEEPYNKIFAELATQRDDVAGTVSLRDEICPDSSCPITVDGIVTRYDGVHFTRSESLAVAPLLAQELGEIGIDLADLTPAPAGD